MVDAADPSSTDAKVRVDVDGGVMTVTMADVAARNALGAELLGGLTDALATAEADGGVRVVVLTNDGTVFCAGANLAEQSSGTGQAISATAGSRGRLDHFLRAVQRSPLPVVGRIAGHAVGGGMGLAAALDISIAADDARFGFTEVRLGVAPAIISVVCLPKMRQGEAMEAFLRGDRFSAARAVDLGLVSRAVPRDRLDESVSAVVDDLRRGGPNALAAAKAMVREVPQLEPGEAMARMTELSARLFASEEAAAGMAAFLEKREAPWIAHPD